MNKYRNEKYLRLLPKKGIIGRIVSRIENYLYKFVQRVMYRVKDRVNIFAESVNFKHWKGPLCKQLIDIVFNSGIIAIIIICLSQKNPFLLGIGVTLFFIVLKSYVEEFNTIFHKR